MDQWVESTRYRGKEEPSLLDLVFTKKPEPPPSIQYLSPMERNDHVTLELEMQEEDGIRYKYDYSKSPHLIAHFTEARKVSIQLLLLQLFLWYIESGWGGAVIKDFTIIFV
ncbi:hypothetical protein E2C01_065947 [Portunus trituberculatus]|uniref:Uncharacterized protein n=1 Tax=Portunus trituberculatus TaxID=210409 RepID=A0A5B7HK77_PORTR|nr:hypothetical protein [Portunus trituberculatus]